MKENKSTTGLQPIYGNDDKPLQVTIEPDPNFGKTTNIPAIQELEIPDPPQNQIQEGDWSERFDKLWGEWDGAPEGSTKGLDWYIKQLVSQLLKDQEAELIKNWQQIANNREREGREHERARIKKNISMLRQWLNERPTGSKLLTNEDIEFWLSLRTDHE